MGKYTGMDGRAITARVREDIARSGVTLDIHRSYTHYPVEHRLGVLDEETRKIRETLAEGRAAIREWADAEAEDARRRLAAKPVGTAAEETRRNTNELRVGRLVESARARGDERGSAADLAERADRAYRSGDLDEADVLARASIELGETRLAGEVASLVEYDRVSADPARARARRELQDLDVVMSAFERDVTGTYSQSLQDASHLARDLGAGVVAAKVMEEATQASVGAKMAAAVHAQETGTEYVEPQGVL